MQKWHASFPSSGEKDRLLSTAKSKLAACAPKNNRVYHMFDIVGEKRNYVGIPVKLVFLHRFVAFKFSYQHQHTSRN